MSYSARRSSAKPAPRIVVIENGFNDRILIAKTIRQLLQQTEITLMVSAAEALRGLLSGIIKADLIFLNYHQSGLSACDFLRCIRQIRHLEHTSTYVFLPTAEKDEAGRQQYMQLGAKDVIQKHTAEGFCQHAISLIIDQWLETNRNTSTSQHQMA